MPDTETAPETVVAPPPPQHSQRTRLLVGLAFIVAIGLAAYGAYWALVGSHYVTTDNAYVGADTALITPLVGGPVARVRVGETQSVKAGDVLVTLDSSDAKLALDQGRAEIAHAQADFDHAKVELARRRALAPSGAVSADELSDARNQYLSAQAARADAQAKLASAQLALSRMTIVSPIDGVVAHKTVDVGQRVEVGAPLMTIVPITQSYVDANFKEVQLKNVAIGEPVTLTSDLYGSGVKFHGHVSGLAGGTGAAFALIPAQNASGNWIKVVQRVPVRIAIDSADLQRHPLRVGLSMKATIDIAKSAR